MSREIKFRVWDKDRKLIGYNRFEPGRWSCQMLKGGGSGEWLNGVLHGVHMDQYTGLQDRNAKDIYEGDLTHGDGSPVWFKVEFVDGSFCLIPIHAHGIDAVDRWSDGKATKVMPLHLVAKHSRRFNLEVFGNIHENPELLRSAEDGK